MSASVVASVIEEASTITSHVGEAVASVASSVTSSGAAAAIPTITAENALGILKAAATKLPVSFYLKIALVTGGAVFSAVVMIKRWMKQRKFKEQAALSGTLFTDYEDVVDKDTIDDYLGMDYTDDPIMFDELDPLMQKIAKNVSPKTLKKISKSKRKKIKALSEQFHRDNPNRFPEYVNWARGISKSYLEEVDKAARDCGLLVEYTIDDDMPLNRRRHYNAKMGFPYLDRFEVG